MNKQNVYLIWEEKAGSDSKTPVFFATTQFEARKQIVEMARKNCNCNVENKEERPLYLGEQPKREGNTLIYSFPGPNESSIEVRDVTLTKPWIGNAYLKLGETALYKVYFDQLPRADSVVKKEKPLPPPSEIVKGSSIKKIRGTDTKDLLLNEIEAAGGKLRSTKSSKAPCAPPLPPPEWTEKMLRFLRDDSDETHVTTRLFNKS